MRWCVSLLLTLAIAAAQPPVPPAKPPLARLESNIGRVTNSINATWGIYIKCLETGEEIAIGADRQMETMSVIKIPLMAEAFRQIEQGKFQLSDRVKLTDAVKLPGTGVIQLLDSGLDLTIKDLITFMIVVSDNTATDLLFAKVGGPEAVTRLMQQWGFNSIRGLQTVDSYFKAARAEPSREKFFLEAKHPLGLSSPRDIGKLLEKIENGEAVSKQASAQMLEIMRRQVYSSRLPRHLDGYRIPHKTGDGLPFIANDVGVLEGPSRRVVVSIFTANHTGAAANLEEAIGRVAELAGNYFNSR